MLTVELKMGPDYRARRLYVLLCVFNVVLQWERAAEPEARSVCPVLSLSVFLSVKANHRQLERLQALGLQANM